MKLKKVLSVMIAVMIFSGSYWVEATGERIKFGEYSVETTEGVTMVTVPLLTKPAGKGATLVAAYIHPDTGRILSVNAEEQSDVSLLSGNIISVSLDDKSSEGGVLFHYIWDSLSGNMSLLNASPAAPADLTAGEESVSTAKLTWEAPLDDYDDSTALNYNIYDDGMLVKENCTDLEYTAEELAWGSEYNFEIRAVDSEGAESEGNSVNAKTILKNTVQTTSDVITSPDGNLEFTGTTETSTRNFYCVKTQAGGLDCYATTLRTSDQSGTYLTYRFSDDYYAKLSGVKKIACELTYFDEGEENVTLDWYCLRNGNPHGPSQTYLTKTNTRTWKTVRKVYALGANDVFVANDNAGNGDYSFRLKSDNKNVGLKVRSFSVFPIYENGSTEEYTDIVKKNAGAYFTADGATITCDMTSNAEGLVPETVAERDGIKLSSLTGNKFDFTVKNTELQEGAVAVIISYYAPETDTTITLGGETKTVATGGKWQKLRFDVTDIGSSANSITANKDICINSVRVVTVGD